MTWAKQFCSQFLKKIIGRTVTITKDSTTGKFLFRFYWIGIWQYDTTGYALIKINSDRKAVFLTRYFGGWWNMKVFQKRSSIHKGILSTHIGELTDHFEIRPGVRQGYVMAPKRYTNQSRSQYHISWKRWWCSPFCRKLESESGSRKVFSSFVQETEKNIFFYQLASGWENARTSRIHFYPEQPSGRRNYNPDSNRKIFFLLCLKPLWTRSETTIKTTVGVYLAAIRYVTAWRRWEWRILRSDFSSTIRV